MRHREQVCVICGKRFNEYGNRPWPVKPNKAGRCCDECDNQVVTPARLRLFQESRKQGDGSADAR